MNEDLKHFQHKIFIDNLTVKFIQILLKNESKSKNTDHQHI